MTTRTRLQPLRLLALGGLFVFATSLVPISCAETPDCPINGFCATTDDCHTSLNNYPGTVCNPAVGRCVCERYDQIPCCIKGSTGPSDCQLDCRAPAECECPSGICETNTVYPLPKPPECATTADCAQPNPRCGAATCEEGKCKVTLLETPLTQLAGDCKVAVCTPTGELEERSDPSDILNDGNQCTTDVCTVDGPLSVPTAGPCPESAGFCNGRGECVECDKDTDCTSPGLPFCPRRGVCTASDCNDRVTSPLTLETDTDCGGSLYCDPCIAGQHCNVDTDCVDGVCLGSKCAIPTCDDGRHNGTETDMDCGSPSCPPCKDGLKCTLNTNCESGYCRLGTCEAPACDDGVRNGKETNVDCGGGCDPCLQDKP